MKEVIVYAETKKNNSDKKIYASMARMYGNNKCTSVNFGNSSQLTYWILDYGSTNHMTSGVSGFIPGQLKDADKRIGVADRHQVTAKQKDKYK